MDALSDSAERLLADTCTPAQIRAIESGAPADALWRQLHESGFTDALTPESKGGAGLCLRDVFPILFLCGKYAVPAPLAFTMLARAILANADQPAPIEPITIAPSALRDGGGGVFAARVPYGRITRWVLANVDSDTLLLPVSEDAANATGVHGSLAADVRWRRTPTDAVRLPGSLDCRVVGACAAAAQLAGAMQRILETTTRYAGDRVQFGRPIAKFQAIQQQLSVMAEQTYAARMAAEIGCASGSYLPDASLAAVAKARTGEAAVQVAAVGHAVHGAIGFTAEYELQLYTRRLHEWRIDYGSEAYWNEKIGRELIAAKDESTLDFIRRRLYPAN